MEFKSLNFISLAIIFLSDWTTPLFQRFLILKKGTLDKHLLRLKTWFSKYDFFVQHIKGGQNLIPNLLSRPPSSASLILISSSIIVLIIFMASSLPNLALTRKSFPCNLTFSSPYQIQDFAKKFVFRYFMNIYHAQSSSYPNFHPDHLFLTGLTIDPSRDITEDELWYLWCLTILYTTKLIFHVQAIFRHLIDSTKAHSLLWALFEWFSPLSWWRKQLSLIINHHHLNLLPDQEGEQFRSSLSTIPTFNILSLNSSRHRIKPMSRKPSLIVSPDTWPSPCLYSEELPP